MPKEHKIKKIAIPIYCGWLSIVFSKDFNYSIKKLKIDTKGRTDMNEFEAWSVFQKDKRGVTHYMILYNQNPSHSTIAHEIVHIVNAIFNDRVMALDAINDEAQAYLTGWITQQVYKFKKSIKK